MKSSRGKTRTGSLPESGRPIPRVRPDKLPFRESQIRQVAQILAPALHGSKPSNLLLYGKTGTGKTAVARLVVEKLHAQDASKKIATCYVNSRIASTEYRTLAKIAESLPLHEDKRIPGTGLSIGTVLDRIFDAIKDNKVHFILVLDEIDYLVNAYGDDVLYQFTRAGEHVEPWILHHRRNLKRPEVQGRARSTGPEQPRRRGARVPSVHHRGTPRHP